MAPAPARHPYDDGLILRAPSPVDPCDEAGVPREAWDWICGYDPAEADLEHVLAEDDIQHDDRAPAPLPPAPESAPDAGAGTHPVTLAELTWIRERLTTLAHHGLALPGYEPGDAGPAESSTGPGPERAEAAALIDAITTLEALDGARAAAQARLSLDFRSNQLDAQARAGVPNSRRGRGIASQLGLARGTSPHRAAHDLGTAHALITELPHTFDHLAAGRITSWAATEVARRTNWLTTGDRAAIDHRLADQLPDWSIRQVQSGTDQAVYRQAPAEAVERAKKAAAGRHVTIRPAPQCMARLSALLPAAEAIAAYKALAQAANTARATGIPHPDGTVTPEGRTRGQLMADILVERVTGQATAPDVPLEVGIIIPAATLTGDPHGADEPAWIPGYGPLPADLARRMLADTTTAWFRRILTDPIDGTITTIESRRRVFGGSLRRLLLARDGQTCRTPYCDAPIRHADHVHAHGDGGATTLTNGAGLCERCNHAKQAPGWHTNVVHTGHAPPGLPADDPRRTDFDDQPHEVLITTPTGHQYRSTAPPALGP